MRRHHCPTCRATHWRAWRRRTFALTPWWVRYAVTALVAKDPS